MRDVLRELGHGTSPSFDTMSSSKQTESMFLDVEAAPVEVNKQSLSSSQNANGTQDFGDKRERESIHGYK